MVDGYSSLILGWIPMTRDVIWTQHKMLDINFLVFTVAILVTCASDDVTKTTTTTLATALQTHACCKM